MLTLFLLKDKKWQGNMNIGIPFCVFAYLQNDSLIKSNKIKNV